MFFIEDFVEWKRFSQFKTRSSFLEYADSLSVAPKENCIIIEDSTNGVKAAKAAGIFCVGYNSLNAKLQDIAMADVIVNHFDELNFEIISNY